MLRDEVEIIVKSGAGGRGALSFYREKFIAYGGPDGGDGGKGGDVVLEATPHLNTLGAIARRKRWNAESGAPGAGKKFSGKAGKDLLMRVPCGTIVRLSRSGEILADLTDIGQRVVVAGGGRGGKGNWRFRSSTNQVPKQFGPGEPGVELTLVLELKLIADVGIMGFPNAGKSTLLSRLSKARPKVADYPFTTLEPQLGVIERSDRQLVLADIPGLIEGAADGRGLGHRFLRHVERCPLLMHLVDGSQGDADELVARIRVLDAELARFSAEVAQKPQLIVLNKLDVRPELPALALEVGKRMGIEALAISGVSGAGLTELENRLLQLVEVRRD